MRLLSALAPLTVLFSVAHCAPPNVIFFVLDDMPFLDQWKESAPAELVDFLDTQYPTPHIDDFRNEAVIFSKSYCGGPKCAPSRYSLLTGRQPSRCEYIGSGTGGTGVEGPTVSVQTVKLTADDAKHSIPYVLQNDATTPYHTGMVGKWHLMPYDDNGANLGCLSLDETPDADLYDACTDVVKGLGFSFVDAWFYSNIVKNSDFSHNPEWMVERSQTFIDEAVSLDKPFFLYFAATLAHSPSVAQALQAFDCSNTPKGKLPGYLVPDDRTTMWPRKDLWAYVQAQDFGDDHEAIRLYATFAWLDQMFGALIDALKSRGVYDDTFIMLSNDHGMEAKGLLYQQGTRIFNFVRYPPRFGKDGPNVLPPDFVVSNVDMAATIFDLAGVSPPDDYTLDGVSYLADVSNQINHPGEFAQSSCLYKVLDIYNSRSIVSGHFQYIFRATDEIDPWTFVRDVTPQDVYPNVYDMEQLYDLDADPAQQINIFNDAQMMEHYAETIVKMQSLMRNYIADICQTDDDEPCLMPELSFATTEPIYVTNVPVTPAPTEQRCCFATDLQNRNAMKCYDIGDNEVECELKQSRWSCAYGQGDDVCAVPTPEPVEPGCCVGSNSKCETDDETKCLRFATRAGCEWISGEDADCAPTPIEPGCCFGANSKCATDDEAQCEKFAVRSGCEWRSGHDADCTAEPVTGCCHGSDSKCDTEDQAKCERFAARAGCEWVEDCEASNVREQVFSVLDETNERLKSNPNVDVTMVAVAVLVLAAVLIRIVSLGKPRTLYATNDVPAGKVPDYGSVCLVYQ